MNKNKFKYEFFIYLLLSFVSFISGAFYVPGVAPASWKEGDEILLNVNKITSVKTLIPYDYYYLPFCTPFKVHEQRENLGEIMSGDIIQDSLYLIQMKKDIKCQIVCQPVLYNKKQIKKFIDKIKEEYFVHWTVDNLPVLYREPGTNSNIRGYPLGNIDLNGNIYLYNHVKIMIKINKITNYNDHENDKQMKWRIVGFEVEPVSIKHIYDIEKENKLNGTLNSNTCNPSIDINKASENNLQYISEKEDQTKILFTYDVQFFESSVPWEHRWDEIISSKSSNDQIHWFSIINSLMIVLFLTGMIAMIMLRTLHRDIAKYNEISSIEESQEESGWKLVHGDVFRPPSNHPMLFSVFVGTGVQVCMMTFVTMIIALLGLLSPANRGSLLTTLLLLFVFMGSFAGYYSSRTYKLFNGKDWKKNSILTAIFYPGLLFLFFFFLNLFLWAEASSQAVPFGTLFALLVLWLGISAPLVFVGSYFGLKKKVIELPVRTNQIARQIPTQTWYLSSPFSILVGGILPFGAVFIELFFVMSALWLHQIYYVFGFLFLVLMILVATCAEVTIVMCYFQLCSEDYRWWWRSFLTSGSAGLYLFLYSFLYFYTKLNVTAFISGLLYFGYMAMISVTFFFLTGNIGFFACFWFIRKIYGSIKID